MAKRSPVRLLFVMSAAALVVAASLVGYTAHAASNPTVPFYSADLQAKYLTPDFQGDRPGFWVSTANLGSTEVPADSGAVNGGFTVTIAAPPGSGIRFTEFRTADSTLYKPCRGAHTTCSAEFKDSYPADTPFSVLFYFVSSTPGEGDFVFTIYSPVDDPDPSNNEDIWNFSYPAT